ncbi:nuclear transport factor 2 family protein [Lewinella sp. JB7]|uniref:nuclear transport factor 2 family protein n=1 Tax=Lewinella sp. JB7 TaxID=2962887 RepID=UPI0020CA0867|nr:nuclear transport factor 2 family protein [Lewinella sp. JB7]MCP9234916.1 nuclear transport factor 2 family protein [Lewinella sp. JB7]
MKSPLLPLVLALLTTTTLRGQSPIPNYTPVDTQLHQTILAMDQRYFDAYNNCDLTTQAAMYTDDFEFYHDRGGLATSKEDLIQALKANICGKVTRYLLPETVEVYPIPGFGAVQLGYHRFENAAEPGAPSVPGRFVAVWRQSGEKWQLHRIISLH